MHSRRADLALVVGLTIATSLFAAGPFAPLIPGLFLLAVWQLGRRIFRTRLALRYVLVVAAFTPPIFVGVGGLAALERGNPRALLAASVPGAAFDRDEGRPLRALRWGEAVDGRYLGLLATPLAAVGLIAGRRRARVPLLMLTVLGAAALLVFGSGACFVILLFAAGLGFETIERRRAMLRLVAIAFPLWSVAALAAYRVLAEPPPALFGFAAMGSAGFATLFAWASRVPRRTRSRALLAGVVALALLDVSTVAFWYLRGSQGRADAVALAPVAVDSGAAKEGEQK